MDKTIGIPLLTAFSVALGLACLYGLIYPRRLVDWVTEFWNRTVALYIAVAARLILGALLLWVASETRYPLGFALFGYLTLAEAVLIPLLGRKKIGSLMLWFRDAPGVALRLLLCAGFAFSCFIYFGL